MRSIGNAPMCVNEIARCLNKNGLLDAQIDIIDAGNPCICDVFIIVSTIKLLQCVPI